MCSSSESTMITSSSSGGALAADSDSDTRLAQVWLSMPDEVLFRRAVSTRCANSALCAFYTADVHINKVGRKENNGWPTLRSVRT
jgi:hypothetical protein